MAIVTVVAVEITKLLNEKGLSLLLENEDAQKRFSESKDAHFEAFHKLGLMKLTPGDIPYDSDNGNYVQFCTLTIYARNCVAEANVEEAES